VVPDGRLGAWGGSYPDPGLPPPARAGRDPRFLTAIVGATLADATTPPDGTLPSGAMHQPTPSAHSGVRAPIALDAAEIDRIELQLLSDQLARMRGMLYAYSDLFFGRIFAWAVIALALLVLGSTELAPAAVVPVPFVVPFAFLETGYLFWYTVFARRHAGRLEQAIDERLGRDALVAHRLEAAYFYPPDAPRIAALSVGNPLGMMSVATLGYTAGAGILWVAGLVGLAGFVDRVAEPGLLGYAMPAALAWTALIAGYLVWSSLARRDEARFMRVLDESYRLPR